MNDRPDLTPQQFGYAIGLLLARCAYERQLVEWGAAHADALASIRETHPEHHRAARDAYRARLHQLKETNP